MSKKEYYLGLDMGVTSVGWAVTDKNYKLLRAKGKDLWGIREFEEAKTAEERRQHRVSRRRRQRELVRIGLLKEYFHDAICDIDPNFYLRLENSKYYFEDKEQAVKNKNSIFCDKDYQDKDYYAEFPTIFHLRKELIHNENAHDVRLIFLALLNMFKHRGHFLNAGLSIDGNARQIKDIFKDFCLALKEETGVVLTEDIDVAKVEEVLSSREYSRSKKAEVLENILGIEKKEKQKIEFIKALCGLKTVIPKLFTELIIEDDKKLELCFSDNAYEEKSQEISGAVGEKYFGIIELMKEIYDYSVLANTMKDFSYLSDARVSEYEKHGNDLKVLKKVIKRYKSAEEYDYFFRSEEAGTYSSYVGSVNSGSKTRRGMKGRKPEDLYKAVGKLLKDMPKDDDDVAYILDELGKESFLTKQLTSSNGVIPNQVHAREMKVILSNAEKYHPFLNERDESGYSVSERIQKLFSFQMPYYIGPTSEESKTGWVVRKEKGQVLPWNLETKIDVKATNEQFISRMVRRCSYINGEKVLPKASLEYESYCVLNEINNISIDGERISVALKQDIYNDLFKRGKKVTRKTLVSYLRAQGKLEDEAQLSGIDISINSSLSTYGKFRSIFGDAIEEDYVKNMIENIVFWSTVYGDAKKILKEKIEEQYSELITPEQLKRILGYKFKDWGRLSKEFLELPGCDKSNGECISLIRMMWETNLNLMELINDEQYTYKNQLECRHEQALKTLTEMKPEDLDDYYFSAPVKRMVWQTLLIIKEVEQILGEPPVRVFIEMTRKPDEKKVRTISRKQKFLDLYKNIKSESRNWKNEIENADNSGKLRSKKMYLYFTQMGRCMYTGHPIDLEELFNDNLYDIDHIYPRHFVKDDNIDNNLVLVKKEKNAHKSDIYPLETSIYHAQKDFWKTLLDKHLITEEKYRRLTGRNSFTDEQKADFIARQLVETSQGTKGVADVLKSVLPKSSTVVYSKASNVSEFRRSRDIVKCRLVNDFHHAHDAYLNIVVGNVYYVKFTQNPMKFIKNEYGLDQTRNRYHLSRMFDWDVIRGDEIAWIGPKKSGPQGTITTVKEMLSKNTPLMTRRNFEAHGAIANETLYGKKKASPDVYIPLKSQDNRLLNVQKYGGFTSASTAYFFLVEYTEKGKRVRTLETVPIYMAEKVEKEPDALSRYCKEELKLVDPEIKLAKIKVQSLIKKDGFFVHISGKTGNQIILKNAVNLCLKEGYIKYAKKLEKYRETMDIPEGITAENNNMLYGVLLDKFNNSIYARRPNQIGKKLIEKQEMFEKLTIENQCQVILELLKLASIGSSSLGADLSLIKEATHCGGTLMSKKISGATEMLLINQSVTGGYASKVDLLKV